jgi:hypothetical protein
VAKTTIATTTKAKTYSVEVSPLALLFAGLARENEALRTPRIPHPPLDRRFSTPGTCIYIQPLYNVHVRPKHIR